MNPLAPYMFWIKLTVIAAIAAGLFGSGYHMGSKHETDKIASAIITKQEEVITTDHKSTEVVNTVAVDYTKVLKTQKEGYDNEISILKKKLARMPMCTVPADVVRLLDPDSASNVPDSTTTGQQFGSTTETTDSTCAAELETAAQNYREICIPNAKQLEAVQKAYNVVRENINSFKAK